MKYATAPQRKKHLRVFKGKIDRYSTTHLKKLYKKLWDRWVWETGDKMDKDKVLLLEKEIESRHGCEFAYTYGVRKSRTESLRKRRKRYQARKWINEHT